jgi:hypothetical protein
MTHRHLLLPSPIAQGSFDHSNPLLFHHSAELFDCQELLRF